VPRLRQVAVLPYRQGADGLEVLIITSKDGQRWLVPKGHVEPELGPVGSAALEALEEAGIEGAISPRPVGSFDYCKRGIGRRVEVYAMAVDTCHADWPEHPYRRREWVPLDEAVDRIHYRPLAALLDALPAHLVTRAVA
jgi:8-oxo-dGTP pyrophosphatase MutT (NUDIX family)